MKSARSRVSVGTICLWIAASACPGTAQQAAQTKLGIDPKRQAELRENYGQGSPGMVVRQIWRSAEEDLLGGRVSLNGRYLSFRARGKLALTVRDLVTGNSWSVASRQPRLYANSSLVSPDGRQVAYVWTKHMDTYSEELRLIGLDGSGGHVLYSLPESQYTMHLDDWSLDGKHILFAQQNRRDGTKQLALVSVADGSVRVLKTFDWRWPAGRFYPDGRYIVYSFPPREDSPNRDVFVLPVDGSRETPLIEHPADDYALDWSPDGGKILFASDRTGSYGVWSISVRDGKPQGPPELVRKDTGPIRSMGFTEEGSLYYSVQSGTNDVYIAKLDPETGRLLAPPKPATHRFSGSNDWPAWSRDGRYLAYVSRRGPRGDPPWQNVSDSQVVVIRSVETGQERELSPKLNRYFRLGWSPDGRALATHASSKGRGLYRIDARTGELTALVLEQPGTYLTDFVDWSPDSKALVYFYGTKEELRLARRDLETEQETVLYRGLNLAPRGLTLSRDGRNIAFSMSEPPTGPDFMLASHALYVMSATGGEPRELVRFQEPGDQPRFHRWDWTPDGRYLVYAKGNPKDQKSELWRIAIDGGKPQKLDLVVEGLRSLRMHPDGQRMVFSVGKFSQEVWVIENFLPALKAAK
jgi:Tol biopolymer transport system component